MKSETKQNVCSMYHSYRYDHTGPITYNNFNTKVINILQLVKIGLDYNIIFEYNKIG